MNPDTLTGLGALILLIIILIFGFWLHWSIGLIVIAFYLIFAGVGMKKYVESHTITEDWEKRVLQEMIKDLEGQIEVYESKKANRTSSKGKSRS